MSENNTATLLNLEQLKSAVAGKAAAFRCRRKLQPSGGAGDKVFPPTYAGAAYAVEQRRVPGRLELVTCVLLDSVQSQANRMEQALQEALSRGELKLPVIEVDFTPYDPAGTPDENARADRLLDAIGKLTSLQVPHRLADAILRDSEIEEGDGPQKKLLPFRKSQYGNALNSASPLNATPIYQLCPTALLFGMWDSTGPKGGLGAKFERAIVSEVVGLGASISESHKNRGVRRDPLEASKQVLIQKKEDGSWQVADTATTKGNLRPSEVNHGSVPFDSPNAGVTIEYAEQLTTLSLIALRRLRFPVANPRPAAAAAHVGGQTVLAALGLCAATLAFESGMGLRSRCLLWPEGPMEWELLAKPGEAPQRLTLDSKGALALLAEAVAAAEKAGLEWRSEPLTLQPSKELLKLVRLSQQQAVKAVGDEGAE